MSRRRPMSRKSSKRSFSKGARRIHGKNAMPMVMRGGFRI